MEMTKIQDPVFGEIEIKHGWRKKQVIQFWNKPVEFTIKAAKYGNEEITDTQRKNYQSVIDNIAEIAERCKTVINMYKNKLNLEGDVIPRTMIFFADGTHGILFDCDWDIEHGLSVSLPDYTVGPQDVLL
jgi:hypothetical protein